MASSRSGQHRPPGQPAPVVVHRGRGQREHRPAPVQPHRTGCGAEHQRPREVAEAGEGNLARSAVRRVPVAGRAPGRHPGPRRGPAPAGASPATGSPGSGRTANGRAPTPDQQGGAPAGRDQLVGGGDHHGRRDPVPDHPAGPGDEVVGQPAVEPGRGRSEVERAQPGRRGVHAVQGLPQLVGQGQRALEQPGRPADPQHAVPDRRSLAEQAAQLGAVDAGLGQQQGGQADRRPGLAERVQRRAGCRPGPRAPRPARPAGPAAARRRPAPAPRPASPAAAGPRSPAARAVPRGGPARPSRAGTRRWRPRPGPCCPAARPRRPAGARLPRPRRSAPGCGPSPAPPAAGSRRGHS